MQSLYQGRPASLRAIDSQVPISFMDTYEELEYWYPFAYTSGTKYPGSPSYSVSTFKELCKLCIILHDVLDRMYCEGKEKRSTENLIQDLDVLDARMLEWKTSLPQHLTIDVNSNGNDQHLPPPQVFSLQAMWNALRVLLHRPLVADSHLHLTLPSTSKSSFAACAEAAMNIVKLVRLYDKAFSVGRAPYLISYATYVAATIHVRIAATRTSHSEAHEHLRTCLSVFSQNSETNYAVRKASIVIEGLMKHMGISIDLEDTDRMSSPDRGSTTHQQASSTSSSNRDGGVVNQAPSVPTLQQQQAFENGMNPEPTMVAGEFVPDLDVDTIIHSFMQEQQMQGSNTYMPMTPSTMNMSNGSNNNMLTNEQGALLNGGYNMFDDTLFGFNASTSDWYYSNISPP